MKKYAKKIGALSAAAALSLSMAVPASAAGYTVQRGDSPTASSDPPRQGPNISDPFIPLPAWEGVLQFLGFGGGSGKIPLDNSALVGYNVLSQSVHYDTKRRAAVEIIISSNTGKPIYEQITSQIKAMIMSGELQTGDPIPSMRALAKSIHVSVITVQKAYEDLQRDGFIETTVGRGSFVSAQNKDFYQEEQQRQAEEHLQAAAEIARTSGIPLATLIDVLTMFYQEEE